MTLEKFSFKVLYENYSSHPFLTFLPLTCQFCSPEVVLLASMKSFEERLSMVLWLLVMLGLESVLAGSVFQAIL
jgi:hypothetical protein